MLRALIIALFLLIGINQAHSQTEEQISIGSKHVLHSSVLNEEREYWINLPESYAKDGSSYKKYPVLILLDGNIHFESVTGMVGYMSGIGRIPEMIVVGIRNVDRRRDYTPDKIVTVRANNSGGGEPFLAFLEKELIPEIDHTYRTEPYRILVGHSLGGLLATHAYMKENTLFKSFIAIDPSFGTWDAKVMDSKLETVTEKSFDRYIYMATANWGKRNIRNRDRHVRLYEALNSKCEGEFPAKLEYFENETHNSIPIIAFYNGISAIFEGYGISYRDVASKSQLEQHFQAISDRLSWSVIPPETLVNRIGYGMLRSRNESTKAGAIDFFLMNTTNYPSSYNAFDSLAEAYEALGDKEKAIENYKKSLELNENNQHARMKIESLSKGE